MIPAVKVENVNEEMMCAICLQAIEISENIRTTFCDHTYHQVCLDAWCKKNISCPICRNDLSVDNMKKEAENRKKEPD